MTEDALNEMQHKVKQVKNLITFQIKYPTVFQKTTFFRKVSKTVKNRFQIQNLDNIFIPEGSKWKKINFFEILFNIWLSTTLSFMHYNKQMNDRNYLVVVKTLKTSHLRHSATRQSCLWKLWPSCGKHRGKHLRCSLILVTLHDKFTRIVFTKLHSCMITKNNSFPNIFEWRSTILG